MNCPQCGESNSTDMAFCIFCGAPLKGSAPAEYKPSVATVAPRTCTNCGQTDSLNSQFCIFCGSRVDGGAKASVMQPVVQSVPTAETRATEQRAAKSRMVGLVACIVAGLLGGAVGLGMSWFYSAHGEAPKSARELPPKGLVILTAQPFSSFQIVSDGRRFLTGKTGPTGDIVLHNIDPKNYDVKVVAPNGEVFTESVQVKGDAPTVLGGETEIFAH